MVILAEPTITGIINEVSNCPLSELDSSNFDTLVLRQTLVHHLFLYFYLKI